jgi:hypothetical protein
VKITRIETYFVDIQWACWTLLKLFNHEGVTGVGECTRESKEETVLGALKDLSRSSGKTRCSSSATGRRCIAARRGRAWPSSPP